MHKNIKKVLSYIVAIVLALGIGVTYAYAVGGNDTNNLMTKTEWQQKIDQIRASIDNKITEQLFEQMVQIPLTTLAQQAFGIYILFIMTHFYWIHLMEDKR